MKQPTSRVGYAYALGAHTMWGLLPIYWKMLAAVPSLEVIAHRVVWSLVFLASICLAQRACGDIVRTLASTRALITLGATGCLIASNWLVYVWAVTNDRIMEASLGYFISPLLTMALGALLLKEKSSISQRVAITIALIAVLYRITSEGQFPWVGSTLAITLSLYGFFRKRLVISPVTGLSVETLLLAPLALAYLSTTVANGSSHFSIQQPGLMALLVLSGVLTSLPLLFFVRASQLLPLSTLGILQYTSPSLQFLAALCFFGEPLSMTSLVSFSLIWLAIAVYVVGEWRSHNYRPTTETTT
mgnify:CR=1 FL=1